MAVLEKAKIPLKKGRNEFNKLSRVSFEQQPDQGKVLGFDFYRDPLNAPRPMITFEEIMRKDIAEKPKVMESQRDLLERRYDLQPNFSNKVSMSRGKPIAVGPTARLLDGLSWAKLAAMTPEEIRSKGPNQARQTVFARGTSANEQ